MMKTLTVAAVLLVSASAFAQPTPKLPIGMNVQSLNYYSPGIFSDAMTASSNWITWHDGSGWDTQVRDSLDLDTNGYPIEIPQTIAGMATKVRCMVNNCYSGRFRILWDGDGEVTYSSNGGIVTTDGKRYITLNGQCDHTWLTISRSTRGNPIRNIRIVPESLGDTYTPSRADHLFDPLFLKGLEPFHALRFMDWPGTNGSKQKRWNDRPKATDFSMGLSGICWEHAITLCNHLRADPWICIPHGADDTYILSLAHLVKNNLNPGLKVYVEYSNEIWNWQFSQAHYVAKNGRNPDEPTLDAPDSIYNALRAVGQEYCNDPQSYCHPEKDAWMMMRTFKLWRSVFAGRDTTRLVRVAAVQHAWYDNTNRVLRFLFEQGNGGCDAVSPGGYFNFESSQHAIWNAMPPANVTPAMILDSVSAIFDSTSGKWTRKTGDYASQYNVDYLVYEGGQHMQPYQQGEWGYNQAVWDAQIHPAMYDMYMKNFRCHVEPSVDCKLFMAFSFVGERESRYGSWGHLEDYSQLNSMATLRTTAPKYQALLDANTAKASVVVSIPAVLPGAHAGRRGSRMHVVVMGAGIARSPLSASGSAIYRIDGSRIGMADAGRVRAAKGAGVCFIRAEAGAPSRPGR